MDLRANQRKKNPHNSLFDLTVMGILCLLGLVCLYPFLTVLAYAFSDFAKLPGHMVTFYPVFLSWSCIRGFRDSSSRECCWAPSRDKR